MTNFLISFFAVKRDLLCLITLWQLLIMTLWLALCEKKTNLPLYSLQDVIYEWSLCLKTCKDFVQSFLDVEHCKESTAAVSCCPVLYWLGGVDRCIFTHCKETTPPTSQPTPCTDPCTTTHARCGLPITKMHWSTPPNQYGTGLHDTAAQLL